MGAMPPFVPTQKHRDRVKSLAALGVSQADIALSLGITSSTLKRHFETELRVGRVEVIAAVGSALVRNATTHNNVIAQIFYLKSQAGWKDRVDINHTHTVTVTHEERLRQLAAEPDEEGRPMLEHDGPAVDVTEEQGEPVPSGRGEAA